MNVPQRGCSDAFIPSQSALVLDRQVMLRVLPSELASAAAEMEGAERQRRRACQLRCWHALLVKTFIHPTDSRMTRTEQRRFLVGTLLPTLVFGMVLMALQPIGHSAFDWQHWRPATCLPDGCFCEALRTTGIRQPSNAWSSLAFVLAAFLIVGHAFARRLAPEIAPRNVMEQKLVYPITLALILMLIGFGSAFYHASLSFAGQFVDVFGMYLIATFILLYNIGRLRPISATTAVASYVLINLVLAALLYEFPLLRRFMFGVVLLVALSVEIPIRRRRQPMLNGTLLWSAIAVMAIGFAIWVLDLTKTFCAPSGVVQGHAIWHVAGAVSALLLYYFYCSEGKAAQKKS